MNDYQLVPGILLFYEDPLQPDASTIFEHIDAFSRYSRLPVYPVNLALGFPPGLSSLEFSVVAFHYSLKPTGWWITPELDHFLLTRQRTYKVAIFQDEIYYFAERLHFLNRFRIDCLYTRHMPQNWGAIYPEARHLKKRVHYLAGYVAEDVVESARVLNQPLKSRPIDVAYRGRRLPFYLGLASQEKARIAERFLEHSRGCEMHLDISVNENQRLYGKSWHEFLARTKGVLGVEGGVSVIDVEGTYLKDYPQVIKAHPGLTFETYAQLMGDRFQGLEDRLYYRSLTPRHFESAAFRNVQILYEGRYDNVLTPGVHYISLRKDFSNFADVLAQLKNDDHLQAMVDRTWQDLVGSGKYSYQSFIQSFDAELEKEGVRFDFVNSEIHARVRNYLDDWNAFAECYYHADEALGKAHYSRPDLLPHLHGAKSLLEHYRQSRTVSSIEAYSPKAGLAVRRDDSRFWAKLCRTARFDLGIGYPPSKAALSYDMFAEFCMHHWQRVRRRCRC